MREIAQWQGQTYVGPGKKAYVRTLARFLDAYRRAWGSPSPPSTGRLGIEVVDDEGRVVDSRP
jgi:hypothetical protein